MRHVLNAGGVWHPEAVAPFGGVVNLTDGVPITATSAADGGVTFFLHCKPSCRHGGMHDISHRSEGLLLAF